MGLVRGAHRDVKKGSGLEANGYAVEFVIDGAFDDIQEFVAVGVEVAWVGRAWLEPYVAEGHFGAGREPAIGQPFDGSPVGTLGYALAEVDDAGFGGRRVWIGHWNSPRLMVSVGERYPAEAQGPGDDGEAASVGWAGSAST